MKLNPDAINQYDNAISEVDRLNRGFIYRTNDLMALAFEVGGTKCDGRHEGCWYFGEDRNSWSRGAGDFRTCVGGIWVSCDYSPFADWGVRFEWYDILRTEYLFMDDEEVRPKLKAKLEEILAKHNNETKRKENLKASALAKLSQDELASIRGY